MKRLTSLVIGCALALAGAALAQQPDEQASPGKKKQKQAAQETTAVQPGGNGNRAQEKPGKQNRTMRERGAVNQSAVNNQSGAPNVQAGKGRKNRANQESANGAATSGQAAANATPAEQQQMMKEQGRKGRKGQAAKAANAPMPAATTGAVSNAAGQNARVKGAKKADPAQVQQIRSQHTNFHAQAKPQQVPAVTFNPGYRIQGSDRWTGPQYEVFRGYHPERHDEGWYRSHYSRVENIGGGYYYWNGGYWYPAWGFNPSAEYYAYDGPIYVGQRAEPPDQVIADVQAELQQMGYYRGEVDGLLGPLTREALAAYQADQGLVQTAAMDQPTLDSLGMS